MRNLQRGKGHSALKVAILLLLNLIIIALVAYTVHTKQSTGVLFRLISNDGYLCCLRAF